jgi:DNA-binding beta-propeller fold protein YncE
MTPRLLAFSILLLTRAVCAFSADIDEFKVKPQQVFEFPQKPIIQRQGDRVTISFTSRAFCDATVAIEDASGRIIRHLASGVLGANAPAPFQKDSLAQSLIWDGKNDQGDYVENPDALTVRVSLGLKPVFERTLFWSPQKRIGMNYPVLRAAPEGMYVAEGYAVDQVRLFDHQGNYLRTAYPFPAGSIGQINGLAMHTFVQNGKTLPLKQGYHQTTLLTCGDNDEPGNAGEGYGVNALGAAAGRLALVHLKLNRLAPDGSSGNLPFEGPTIGIPVAKDACGWSNPAFTYAPLSAAISPDGKWLYLAGYHAEFNNGWGGQEWMNGVYRMPYAGQDSPTLFAGSDKPGTKSGGTDEGQFRAATSVACDAQGRVYVSDYMNDRIQVFDSTGKRLKIIPVAKPAYVAVHQKTGDIYVFSWMLRNMLITSDQTKVEPTMTHLGPLENPEVKNKCPLPLTGYNATVSWNTPGGVQHRVELDSWTEKPSLWIVNGKVAEVIGHDDGSIEGIKTSFDGGCCQLYEESPGKLLPTRNCADDVKKSVARLQPPILWRQRLAVNPATGKLYVAEGDSGVMKSCNQQVEISPEDGSIRLLDLPLGAEDLCFDVNSLAYIRTDPMVSRFDAGSWREVPWDYGEELKKHSFGMGAKEADLKSALRTPGHRSFNFWHMGGLDVSATGHMVVSTCNGSQMADAPEWHRGEAHFNYQGQAYVPPLFPGRMRWGEVHVYDKHGVILYEDAVPGVGHMNGIKIDRDDNIYMMLASRRLIDGKPFDPTLPRDASCTLVKVAASKSKFLSTGGSVPVPLADADKPNRPPDLVGYNSGWVEGAKWFFGGVGFGTPGACVCWNSRFDMDLFARCFAPEPLCYSVAVLDSNGNLILHIGQYGNVDDGKPLIATGGPSNPHSIGGDEVALTHACYVAVHTDHRLFIADAGNARIVSVKLDYHATEKVRLGSASDK